MRMVPERGPPTIALTFDACSGRADERIIGLLVQERIPATVFVTTRWLRRNPQALAVLLAHPALFQIENHGRHHKPAIDRKAFVYGLPAAGSPDAVAQEIEGGLEDIARMAGVRPAWYRGAAALYTESSLGIVAHLGQRVAGYSLAPDGGALLSRSAALRRTLSAANGDVLLAHINHPDRPAGQGVAEGILELKKRGFRFVRLGSPGLRFLVDP
jgi:peptidoglycan/xylan/chitin deacetylase (PgdA/CDA1 family)